MALPLDVSRTLEELLDRAELDFVHVHEPFAPSAASAALRHSRALNVGSFHSATERLLSTQVARPLVERLFGRLDARTASFAVTRDLVARFFPGEYEVIRPGAELQRLPAPAEEGPPHIVLSAQEERGAMRLFLRALRRLSVDHDWQATIWMRDPETAPVAVAAPPAARPGGAGRARGWLGGPVPGLGRPWRWPPRAAARRCRRW